MTLVYKEHDQRDQTTKIALIIEQETDQIIGSVYSSAQDGRAIYLADKWVGDVESKEHCRTFVQAIEAAMDELLVGPERFTDFARAMYEEDPEAALNAFGAVLQEVTIPKSAA